jgi:hypothetical protein
VKWRFSTRIASRNSESTIAGSALDLQFVEDVKYKYWPHLAIAVFFAIAALMFHRSSLQPVLASSDDDVKKLTEIVMQESKVSGLNPASIALEQKRLADTVTFVGATGVVKHLEKDALLATAGREASDLKFSIATSALQVHLYGDTAIVTYQREIKQFSSSENLPILANFVGRPFACIDTFIKRNGEWKAVARAWSPNRQFLTRYIRL